MPEAGIGVASAPLASTSVRGRERMFFMMAEPHLFSWLFRARSWATDGLMCTPRIATLLAKSKFAKGPAMPDRDDLGSAWKVPPSRYLAARPAPHSCAPPRSLYAPMAHGRRLSPHPILPPAPAPT